MAFELNQLCIDTDHRNNPIFAEYRFATIAHDDLGGWLLAIDDGRYVICETDDAVNIYGRNRDDLMARHDRGEWSDPAHGEGALVSRAAQSAEARIKELQAALSSAQADREALAKTLTELEALNAEVLRTWTARHAPDECNVRDVKAANERCGDGTLWYIATSNKKAMDLMDALPAHLRSEAEGKATP